MDFVSGYVAKLWSYTVAPIAKQVGYVISYHRNIRELMEEVEELKIVRESVQHDVAAAVRNGVEIELDVHNWLAKVDEIYKDYEELNNDERRARAGCSSRSFPNIKYRHKLSRQSKKMKKAMIETMLRQKFDRVFLQVPKFALEPQMSTMAAEDPNVQRQLESRVLIQNEITNALSDPMVHTIGIYGLGGVGKTTLVKAIAKKIQQDKLFDVVAFVNVTHSPNLERIQKEIADTLGLEYENGSLIGRACRLRDRLLNMKHKRVLLILDDLWEELKMDDVGIPFAHNGLKIIMTSRKQDLLSKMNTQKLFFLDVLTEGDAWKLFKEKAQLNESTVSDEFRSIATQVFEECACLPIAIVTIASALKKKDLLEWKDVLRTLKAPAERTIIDMQDKIFKLTKVSYDKLENDLYRSIFLLCGVMQQDSLVTDLFNISFGLGLFEEINNLEDARNRLYTCIRELKDSCLLLESDSCEHFNMHDVVQEAAIFLASRQQNLFIKRYQRLEEWPKGDQLTNCKTIIIDHCDFDELPEELYCPSLTFFHLNNKTDSLKIADNFFKGMLELRVLILAGKKLDCLPSSIYHLSKLHTLFLNLDELGDWGIIGELKSLRVLTLRFATMTQLPLELSQLTWLQLLDLRDCYNLVIIPSNLLSRLTGLEELYFPNYSFSNNIQWNVHGKEAFDGASDPRNQQSQASLAELNDLARLATLELCVCDENMVPKDLVFDRLRSYKIIIGSKYYRSLSEYETSRILELDLNTGIHLWHNLKRLLYSVEYLYLHNLKGAANVLPETNEEGMPELKYLRLQSNDEIQTIVDSLGWDLAVDIFPNLESLVINDCMNLKEICNGYLTERSFSRLRVIKVVACDKMKSVFSLSRNENATRMLQLPELQSLWLHDLPELISFWHEDKKDFGAQQKQLLSTHRDGEMVTGENIVDTPITLFNDKVMLPSLEKIIIQSMDKLNTIWHREQQLISKSFGKLRKLEIECCPKLVIVFPSHIGISLHSLETLSIKNCESLEHVFDVQGIDGKEIHSEISGLPRELCFPSLKKVHVASCKRLKYLFPAFVAKTLDELQSLKIEKCSMIEDIFIKEETNNPCSSKVMLPNLEEIIIRYVKKLNTIWNWQQQLCPKSFGKLRKLEIECCPKLVIVFPSHIGISLHSLEALSIKNCESLEHVFDVQGVYTRETHSEISGLPVGVLCFSNLQQLNVEKCERLKYLFPALVAKTLEKLQSLKVEECSMIKYIIIKEENSNPSSNERDDGDTDYDITFSKLKFLKLQQLSRLRSFSSKNFIFKFPSLEKFIVIQCPKLKSFLEELPITPSLQSVQIDDEGNESYWEGNLNATIQKIYTHRVEFRSIRLSKLTEYSQLKKLWQGHVSMKFIYLTSLVVDGYEFDSNVVIPFNVLKSLVNLEEILVLDCKSVEAVFDLEGINNQETNVTLETQLKELTLESLPDLKHVWNGDSKEIVTFQNLQIITARQCEQLTCVFPAKIAKGLTQLEELTIQECGVEEIVAKEEGQAMFLPLMFPELTNLTIQNVPSLKCFYQGDCIVECPKLRELSLHIQSEVGNFVTQQLLKVMSPMDKLKTHWQQQLCPTSFDQLKKLDFDTCSKLKIIFPSLIGSSLHSLETLLIKNCESLEHIFDVKGVYARETHNEISCLSTGMLCFPNLQQVHVEGCKRLKYLFLSSVAKNLGKLQSLKIKDCSTIEEIIIKEETNNPYSNEMVIVHKDGDHEIAFNKLKFLELLRLPRLKSFSSGNFIFKFPLLEYFIVGSCTMLTTFSEEMPSTPNLEYVQIKGEGEGLYWKNNLNTTLQTIYDKWSRPGSPQSMLG